jgi:flagellar motor switch protein FliN/FliY
MAEKAQAAGGAAEKRAAASPNLAFVADVPLRIAVQLGETRMCVRDVLALDKDSLIELDRAVGEPADVLVNGRVVARADLTVVDDRIAVRIVELIAAHDAGAAE